MELYQIILTIAGSIISIMMIIIGFFLVNFYSENKQGTIDILDKIELLQLSVGEIKTKIAVQDEINKKLNLNGTYIGCVETYMVRKHRLLKKYPKPFNHIYYFFDFILTRIFPKIW